MGRVFGTLIGLTLLFVLPGGTAVAQAGGAAELAFAEHDVSAGVCILRDEGEGEGEGEPEGASGPPESGGALRHVVPLAAAALFLAGLTGAGKRRRRLVSMLLGGAALLAVGNYTDFGRWTNGRYVNPWEFFHYYMGSKYLPELGYTRLYSAALIADVETGRRFRHPKDAVRNLVDGGCIPVDTVLGQRDEVVGRFTKERWTEFKRDVVYFKETLSPFQWGPHLPRQGVQRDAGLERARDAPDERRPDVQPDGPARAVAPGSVAHGLRPGGGVAQLRRPDGAARGRARRDAHDHEPQPHEGRPAPHRLGDVAGARRLRPQGQPAGDGRRARGRRGELARVPGVLRRRAARTAAPLRVAP